MRIGFRLASARRLGALVCAAALPVGCHTAAPRPDAQPDVPSENPATVSLALEVVPGVQIDTVSFEIDGPTTVKTGAIDVGGGAITAALWLPAGKGYKLSMSATSTDKSMSCAGASIFDVAADSVTQVTVRLTCQAYTDLACSKFTCDTTGCRTVFSPAGTPASGQTAGSCRVKACDGKGNVITTDDPTNVPVDGKQCTDDLCVAGVPSNPPLPYGTPCSQGDGTYCDGRGGCVGSTTFRVVRVGNGSTPLTDDATAAFVEERGLDGSLVSMPIALPIQAKGAAQALTLSGTGESEGALSLSGDGRYLTLAGYGISPGVANVAGMFGRHGEARGRASRRRGQRGHLHDPRERVRPRSGAQRGLDRRLRVLGGRIGRALRRHLVRAARRRAGHTARGQSPGGDGRRASAISRRRPDRRFRRVRLDDHIGNAVRSELGDDALSVRGAGQRDADADRHQRRLRRDAQRARRVRAVANGTRRAVSRTSTGRPAVVQARMPAP